MHRSLWTILFDCGINGCSLKHGREIKMTNFFLRKKNLHSNSLDFAHCQLALRLVENFLSFGKRSFSSTLEFLALKPTPSSCRTQNGSLFNVI